MGANTHKNPVLSDFRKKTVSKGIRKKYAITVGFRALLLNPLPRAVCVTRATYTGGKFFFSFFFFLLRVFRKTGNMRPTIGPLRGRDRHCYNWLKNKWRPPKGMHIDHEDLVSLSNEAASGFFVTLDREIASLKRQVIFLDFL